MAWLPAVGAGPSGGLGLVVVIPPPQKTPSPTYAPHANCTGLQAAGGTLGASHGH